MNFLLAVSLKAGAEHSFFYQIWILWRVYIVSKIYYLGYIRIFYVLSIVQTNRS